MSKEYARIRIDGDQCELWFEVLREARNARIAKKIELRDHGDDEDLMAIRWELNEINRMYQEVQRAKQELE